MSWNCTVFFLWSACTDDGFTLGSIGEWLTMLVAIAALIAAIRAGKHAKISAESARAAFLADIKVREEEQARLVYSEVTSYTLVRSGSKVELSELEVGSGIAWDKESLTDPVYRVVAGHNRLVRETTADVVKVDVIVRNRSAELITRVHLYFADRYRDTSTTRVPSLDCRSVMASFVDVIPPGEKSPLHTITIPLQEGVDASQYTSTPREAILAWDQVIEFRDSNGAWWMRRGVDPVVKLDRKWNELP